MNGYEKIIDIGSEWQAQAIEKELQQRNIPHLIKGFRDSTLDALFQSPSRSGYIEAPSEFKDDIITIVTMLRNQPVGETDDAQRQAEKADLAKSKRNAVSALIICTVVLLGSWVLFNWHIRTHYITTTGRVVSVTRKVIGERQSYKGSSLVFGSHVVIEYWVNGNEVSGQVDVSDTSIRRGDNLTVLYSRTNPEQFMLK